MANPRDYSSQKTTSNAPPVIARKTKEPARYKCDSCPKAFTRSATLKQHQRTHTGERPYKCASCSKAFARLKDMKRHELLHSTEKQFICDGTVVVGKKDVKWGCGKKFAREDGLVAHLRSVENLCAVDIEYLMFPEMNADGTVFAEHLNHHGTWTCHLDVPRNLSKAKAISVGCGRKYREAQSLLDHLKIGNGSQCMDALISMCESEAVCRAIGRAGQVPEEDQISQTTYNRPSSHQNVKTLSSISPLGSKKASMEIGIALPQEVNSWRPFDVTVGGLTISDFEIRGPHQMANVYGTHDNVYWIDLPILDMSLIFIDDENVRIRANLEGDWNSYSYHTMTLRTSSITETVPCTWLYSHARRKVAEKPSSTDRTISGRVENTTSVHANDAAFVWTDNTEIIWLKNEVAIMREEHTFW